MAIIYNDKYNKIIKRTNNFVTNVTEIEFDVYSDKEARDLEKKIKNDVDEFKYKVRNFLRDNMTSVLEEISKITPIDEITDKDKFLKENPEIAKKIEYVESVQNEGLNLVGLLSIKDIDLNSLKHRDVWEKLGLNEELCSKINYVGTSTISVDGIVNSNISDLYNAVKTTIVGEFIDC